MNRTHLLNTAIWSAVGAGKKIMEVYFEEYKIDFKDDLSPLTIADKNAHEIISKQLSKTNIPILSEEGTDIPYEIRSKWAVFWMVDPLDGTKEFIKKNGEFTVNIALIEENRPTMGVIFCPVLNHLYIADKTLGGAFKVILPDNWRNISREDTDTILKIGKRLPFTSDNRTFTIAASRSHLNDETKHFIENIQKQKDEIEFLSRGSSLKLCMIAEGHAQIYPRFAPTSEWDTAAGQAIVEHAGGKVIQAQNKKPVTYNKKNILNPSFLAITKNISNTIEL